MRVTPTTRAPLAVEALGYLGGIIITVGAMLVAARYWNDFGTGSRLAVVGGAAAVLLAVGAAVPRRLGDMGERLRGVLWLASTLAVAGFLGLLFSELVDQTGRDVELQVTAGTAAYAGALWLVHRFLLQQLALMVSLAMLAGVGIAHLTDRDPLPGVGVWAVGAVWLVLGWGGWLAPGRAAMALGSATALIGAALTMSHDAGVVLSLVTAAAVVALAVLFRDLVLLGVGAVGMLVLLPIAVGRWFPDALAAPLALLVIGVVLVGVAVWIARRRHEAPPKVGGRDLADGNPRAALVLAAVLAVAAATVVAAVGFS